MPILPLPQFEADLAVAEADRKTYDALVAPKTIVVRYGMMKYVGEFPYSGEAKPGCGSKIVIRTPRGTEIGEMLTSTCPNAGCSKSVTRKEMLEYIENSGGRDFPFFTEGRALRVASPEDMSKQEALEQSKHGLKLDARRIVESLHLNVKIVDVEPILGGERLTFYYLSEERVDVRELAHRLSEEYRARIDLRPVGARDEARLTADYERCGQHCCCKNFLKILKPVSMRSAKVQKATLDPLKISGRCGRLMCCLRYEDETYETLRKRLPHRKSRVGTPEGDGMVLDSQILTQLVLVELDALDAEGKIKQVAVAVEELTPPTSTARPVRPDPEAGRPSRSPDRPPRRDGPPAPAADRRPQDRSDRGRPPSHQPEGRPPQDRPAREQRPPAPPSSPPPVDDISLDDIPTEIIDSSAPPEPPRGAGHRDDGARQDGPRRRRRRRRGRGGPPQTGPREPSPPSET